MIARIVLSFLFILNILSPSPQLIAASPEIKNGERPLVIIIPSYNNKEWYKRNLDSVFSQQYANYRIIYIDDCSTDGTADLVEQYVKSQGKEDKVLILKNEVRRYKMANLYRAYHICDDSHVIIELDGDDWLMHDKVFARYNQIYANPNIWMTYGHFMEWPTNAQQLISPIQEEIIATKNFRERTQTCFWAGLRTYYAWLVKQIALKDFIFKGQFLTMTSDAAIMIPMFEMARERQTFLSEMMLEHNVATNLNDHKVNYELQFESYCHILALDPYKRLYNSVTKDFTQERTKQITLYVSSNKSPGKLLRFLESLKNCTGLDHIIVLHSSRDQEQDITYQKIFAQYPEIIEMSHEFDTKIGAALFTLACNGKSDYCLFADDGQVFTQPIDLRRCVQYLEQTKAHAFFLMLNQESMGDKKHIDLEEDVCAAQLLFGGRIIQSAKATTLALYRTSDIQNYYHESLSAGTSSFTSPLLDMMRKDLLNVGLFFKKIPIEESNK